LISATLGVEHFSATHWKSLRYFNLYRFVVATLLFTSALLYPSAFPILSPNQSLQHLALASVYLLSTTLAVILAFRHRWHARMQLTASVLVDVLVMTLLIHIGGGLDSGLGAMLLVTLAGAGLVGEGRLVLFYAAMATLALLFEHSYRALQHDIDVAGFFHAGLFSAGFFAVAVSARLLARRVIANEALALQRGVDLNNQTLISQRVIEEMQDGVVVLRRDGRVKQCNPRARQVLGLDSSREDLLAEFSPELALGFVEWCRSGSDDVVLVRVPASGMQLRARFAPTESSESDVLVFLEDLGRLQEQAQQLKLAALGRLTANIAHEIRNPLSAISHAGELLREERRGETYERLLRIMLDNTRRLERIVSDVLELGRRDRTYRELIDLRATLPLLVEEYLAKEALSADVVRLELSGVAALCFDRSHFHQVLGNLLGNALRHSQRMAGSVRLVACDGKADAQVELHVIDDGEGVGEGQREHIFEPFFTTHHRGTGLGLYIARELCDANATLLELHASRPGADFRLLGRSSGCH
jgi:two-component system sensor histidine kinase PilS (NtrC family)